MPGSLPAEQRELKVEQSDKVDAVLLLDASGSMRVTDPGRLRDEGAKLFVQFLKPGDRLAIIAFSESAQIIRPLSDYDSNQTEQINADIAKVGNSGQYTDLQAGVKAAQEMLAKMKREGATPAIVLLSDGKMDPDPKSGSAQTATADLLNKILPDLKATEIKVHTLAFSDQADKDLLAQIAVGTEGAHYFTPNADKVHESYADLFVVVKKPQMLPLTSKGFKIDADIEEATFYVNAEEGVQVRVLTPSGKEISAENPPSNVKWFKGQKFDVITVSKPEVGDWKILGLPTNDGFATVLTNLKLVTDWPATLNAGTPTLLQARLYESEKPIVLPEMTQAIRYAFQIVPTDRVSEPILREGLHDDGTHGDKIANDGIFSFSIELSEPGEYKLQIVAQAPTFERRQQIAFRLKPRVVTLSVLDGEAAPKQKEPAKEKADGHGGHDEHGHEAAAPAESSAGDVFLIELSPEITGSRDIELKLVAVDKQKKRTTIPVASAGDALTYRGRAANLPHDGEYELQVTLTAEGKKKNRIREMSNTIEYTKVTVAGHEEEHEVIVVEKKPEEEPDSPILPILLLTLLNAGAAAGGYFLIKRAQSEVSFKVPDFEPLEDLKAAIAQLEAAAALTEIDLNDARLSDEKLAGLPLLSGSSASRPASPTSAPAAEGAKPQAEKAEKEEAPAAETPTPPAQEGGDEGGAAEGSGEG